MDRQIKPNYKCNVCFSILRTRYKTTLCNVCRVGQVDVRVSVLIIT